MWMIFLLGITCFASVALAFEGFEIYGSVKSVTVNRHGENNINATTRCFYNPEREVVKLIEDWSWGSVESKKSSQGWLITERRKGDKNSKTYSSLTEPVIICPQVSNYHKYRYYDFADVLGDKSLNNKENSKNSLSIKRVGGEFILTSTDHRHIFRYNTITGMKVSEEHNDPNFDLGIKGFATGFVSKDKWTYEFYPDGILKKFSRQSWMPNKNNGEWFVSQWVEYALNGDPSAMWRANTSRDIRYGHGYKYEYIRNKKKQLIFIKTYSIRESWEHLILSSQEAYEYDRNGNVVKEVKTEFDHDKKPKITSVMTFSYENR